MERIAVILNDLRQVRLSVALRIEFAANGLRSRDDPVHTRVSGGARPSRMKARPTTEPP